MTAAGAQDTGERVGIEEQRKRRAQRQGRVGAIGARRMQSRRRQQKLLRGNRGKNLMETAQLDRDDDDCGQRRDINQDVLDDGDRRRCAKSARIGEGGQHDEGNEQRQISDPSSARDAERADHHLDADELQGDVRHGRYDSGDGHRERQPAISEPAAYEIAGGDVAALMAHMPKSAIHQE